ncbi:tripartite motif-containing protein 16-like isoform X2 [Ictalurus furcatus]|uniref:tripartite motif-containing protein 16-like isoform X2 n=1 Tax=Ictalurus furcatus TaxID=66913 RepID=UPI002350D4AC|nr:tripartite motif-containing protein 16-like isoform X2 [Ictalurus furcatus]
MMCGGEKGCISKGSHSSFQRKRSSKFSAISLSALEFRKMAEASISVDQLSVHQFSCPVCLHLLKDPVAIPCGHSYCMLCINDYWDQEDESRVYRCPQCRDTFTPRPVLRRNIMLAEVVEKLKKTEVQAASPAHCYAGPGDVECDFCTGRKHKAVKSCLMCLASSCETHLRPHLEIPGLKKHKLVEASGNLQEKICSEHDKVLEIYCRTDQSFICYLCMTDEHKSHDTVSVKAYRTEKQRELKEEQMKSQQRIQEKQKKVQELKQAVNTIKLSAQTAVEDSERIFTEMISSMEKRRSEVTELIRAQEKAELSRAERLLEQLEQEITDLQRRVTELEQLPHTDNHLHFLQSFQSLYDSSGSEDSRSITVNQHLSFDGVRKSLSALKKTLEEFCQEEFIKIPERAAAVQIILPSEPKSREDFLQYFCDLTLDPNTVNYYLILSEKNRAVTYSMGNQQYSDHPERFDYYSQVLSKESVYRRCYWEVEWSGVVYISVSYKDISRKGWGQEHWFGGNKQSWSLCCSSFSLSFYHNYILTDLRVPSSSRIGVYVDHSAGTLSFYSVSDTMKLLHRVHTTFTQPLYAGFWLGFYGSTVRLNTNLLM